MKKIAILTLALLAMGVGMSLPSTLRAEDQPAAPPPPSQNSAPNDHDGMMMGGDMQGMMKMMGQMTKMMDKCDQMMQTKIDDQTAKPESPKTDHRG